MWPRASNVVSWGRDGEVGKAGLELAGWNNFGRLWDTGAVPSCVVPLPGVITAGGWWPKE